MLGVLRKRDVCFLQFSCSEASLLATALRPHLTEFPSHVVVASGLKSRQVYLCTASAKTHAGEGERSTSTSAETLAVPPQITDLLVPRKLPSAR